MSRVIFALLLVFLPVVGQAQKKPAPLPKRPKAVAVTDTNDARQYLNLALEVFDRDPGVSADAFYWASRIDPTLADAFYGRRSATILRSQSLLRLYIQGGKRARESKDMRTLDSLFLRAMVQSPFLYRRLDHRMLLTFLKADMQRSAQQAGTRYNDAELEYHLGFMLRTASPEMRAWAAYSEGSFPIALRGYADAMGSEREKAWYRVERARIFAMGGNADSAIAEFQAALTELRTRDNRQLVVLYDSKAMLEHSIGVLLEGRGDAGGAREAYGRALQEDLSFYPAHLRLGFLAISARDSTTAAAEFALATQVAPEEPYAHFSQGSGLGLLGLHKDAVVSLRRAIELEPYWALPHYALGNSLVALGEKEAAVQAYNDFLSRASGNAPVRAEVQQRLQALKSGESR